MTDTPIPEGTSPLDPWTLESLLAEGGELGTPEILGAPGTSALAMLIAAARGPAVATELLGEDEILAAFRNPESAGISSHAARRSRRSAMLSALLSSKIALAAAVGVVAMGGASAAAYAGVLPAPVQDFAHHTIGAPAPKAANAVGPDATGDAAYGLCQAFATDKVHGKADQSVAYRNLATAAGGAANIEAFCRTVQDQKRASATASPTDEPSAKPTDPGEQGRQNRDAHAQGAASPSSDPGQQRGKSQTQHGSPAPDGGSAGSAPVTSTGN